MKKCMIILTALLSMTIGADAMSYRQAREQALFLTDKMAYELNLTDDQYEAAYEINLDYLMSIDDDTDLYGRCWRQRNIDLGYILLDWQYRAYCAANYFYRPLYRNDGYWHFSIYARYPHRDYFYFGRPTFFSVYCGDHSWRMNGGQSWYSGRTFGPRYDENYIGMRDGFVRGDFGRGSRMIGNPDNPRFIRYENSSEYQRSNTFGRNYSFGERTRNIEQHRSFGGGSRNTDRPHSFGNGNYDTNRSHSFGQESTGNNRIRSFGESSTRTTVGYGSGDNHREFGGSGTRRNFFGGGSSSPNRTFGAGHFSGSSDRSAPARSINPPSRSFGGFSNGTPSRSFGNSGNNTSTRSSNNGNTAPTRNFGSGDSGNSGGHFGGRR